MHIEVVPALTDNYAFLVSGDGVSAFVVDPSEAPPVQARLKQLGWTLSGVFCTHHHWDHVGGVSAFSGVPVYAPARVEGSTHELQDGEKVHCAGLEVTAMSVPGHTLDAVALLVGDAVFTGDTLFLGGCGRLFEGTPAQMYTSLQRLAALPPQTRVYCGHEYAAANLRFAAAAEPDNAAVRSLQPRMPGTMAEELASNPFIRAGSVERFAELREWKNRF